MEKIFIEAIIKNKNWNWILDAFGLKIYWEEKKIPFL
jgi:hypothetical protein